MQNLPVQRFCVRCRAALNHNEPFCNNCGSQQPSQFNPVQKSKKNGLSATGITAIVLVCVLFGSCGLCGLIGAIADLKEGKQQTSATNTASALLTTPTPTPELTNAVKLQRAKDLFLGSEDETQFNAAKALILSVPKEAREYKEAQKVYKEAQKEFAENLIDLALIGERPTTAPARTYLRNNLNDYHSSEFIEWSPVLRTYIKNEPYWSLSLKLRAKNPFGVYLIKNVTFYMRHNQVIKTEGL